MPSLDCDALLRNIQYFIGEGIIRRIGEGYVGKGGKDGGKIVRRDWIIMGMDRDCKGLLISWCVVVL